MLTYTVYWTNTYDGSEHVEPAVPESEYPVVWIAREQYVREEDVDVTRVVEND